MADVTPLIRDELLPPRGPGRRHLISMTDLTKDDVERLLALARTFARSLEREVKKLPALKGRTVVNVFYESSTRTSSSFELAAKRLSADVMSIKATGSSVDKGESLKDTALTIGAYDPDVVVLRHPAIGAPQIVARTTNAHVVNAGDGTHQHPTQALLDLYTIDEELGGTPRGERVSRGGPDGGDRDPRRTREDGGQQGGDPAKHRMADGHRHGSMMRRRCCEAAENLCGVRRIR